MRCKHARDLVTALALGDLGEADAAALGDHIRTCAGCRAEWEETRFALGALRTEISDLPDPGPAFWNAFPHRVRAGMREEREREKAGAPLLVEGILGWLTRPRVLVPVGAVAAAVLAVAVALMSGTDGGTQGKRVQQAKTAARIPEEMGLAPVGNSWIVIEGSEAEGLAEALGGWMGPGNGSGDADDAALLLAGGSLLIEADLDEEAWQEVDRRLRGEYGVEDGNGNEAGRG